MSARPPAARGAIGHVRATVARRKKRAAREVSRARLERIRDVPPAGGGLRAPWKRAGNPPGSTGGARAPAASRGVRGRGEAASLPLSLEDRADDRERLHEPLHPPLALLDRDRVGQR